MTPNRIPGLHPSAEWPLQDLVLAIAGEDVASHFHALLADEDLDEVVGEFLVPASQTELESRATIKSKCDELTIAPGV
jgi:hypothetical protein